MAFAAETQAKIAEWRQKIRDNTITQEELREALIVLREGRKRAAAVSAASRARAAKAPINSDDLLSELGGL